MLQVAGVPFTEHQINKARSAGITEIVLATSFKAELFEPYFGDGANFGISITLRFAQVIGAGKSATAQYSSIQVKPTTTIRRLCPLQKEALLMAKSRDDILAQKEFLAAEALKVANESLGYLQDSLSECSVRDLVSIFNAAVKTHRDIVSDIVSLTETESKDEASLAKEYDSKVDVLLNKLKGKE
jgi:hypothetical protein